MGSKGGAEGATPAGTGTEQNGGCQVDEGERHGAIEKAKAPQTDDELAVEGRTLQGGQGLDGLYGIRSHELDATLGKVSGHEVATEESVEADTKVFGKALTADDVDCTEGGQGDVTGGVSDEEETGNNASLEASGSEKSVPGKPDKLLLVSRGMQ